MRYAPPCEPSLRPFGRSASPAARAPASARRPACVALLVLVAGVAAGCDDDVEKRLGDPLKEQGLKELVVGEEKIVATCSTGATVEVEVKELERNFLGMAKTSKVATIAKSILRECEDKDAAKRQEEAIAAKLGDETKRLGIDATGKDDATLKKEICAKLTEQLPRKDPERTIEGAKNTQRWGCDAPPPPAELPSGAWAIELGQAKGKRPATSFLRLENADGEKLTLRCAGKKPDLYVQPAAAAKKRTKVVTAKVDGGKPLKWKVKPSSDGRALFFADTKAAFKALDGAGELAVIVPTKKKPITATFAVKGFGEALKQLPKGCQ